jgi:hypothetical protein
MSNYTLELREYIEAVSEALTTRDKIADGRSKLFDFDYPLFDVSFKNVFETNFIRNFYTREIGQETIGLFKFRLETWLNINMPYWNKMFETELLVYDPLTNSKVDVTHNKTNDKTQNDTNDGTNTVTTTGTSDVDIDTTNTQTLDTTVTKTENGTLTDDKFDRHLESNNPDSRLQITTNDGQGVIEYANLIKENNKNNTATKTGTTTNTNTGTITDATLGGQLTTVDFTNGETKHNALVSTVNDVEDFVQQRIGKIGVQSYPKLVGEYRQSLLRIQQQIFDEMNVLFMCVY